MGGQKKRSIAQAEKSQSAKEKVKGKKKEKSAAEKKAQVAELPKIDDKALISELKKMKAITPTNVASTYSVKISTAKGFLKELENRGIVTLVQGCKRIKIYKSTMPDVTPAQTPAS
jgi:ribosomal protein S25